MHKREFRANTRLQPSSDPGMYMHVASMFNVKVCWDITGEIREMLHRVKLQISSWDSRFRGLLSTPLLQLLLFSMQRECVPPPLYVTDILCLSSMFGFHYWSGRPLSLSLSICVHLFVLSCPVLCWIPADVFCTSAMPWSRDPLWRIDLCREPWLCTRVAQGVLAATVRKNPHKGTL